MKLCYFESDVFIAYLQNRYSNIPRYFYFGFHNYQCATAGGHIIPEAYLSGSIFYEDLLSFGHPAVLLFSFVKLT